MPARPRTVITLAWWCAGIAAVGAGGAWVCASSSCGPLPADRAVLGALHALRSPWLDAVLGSVTWLGSVSLLAPLAAFASWRFARTGRPRAAVFAAGSLVGAFALVHLGKFLFERPRPALFDVAGLMPGDPSFPSAHSAQIAAFAIAIALVLRSGSVWLLVALVIGAVAFSRLYLQVHFPTDVAAGLLLGACWALGLHALLRPESAPPGQPETP